MKTLFTPFILLFTLLYFYVIFYCSPLEINQGYVQKIMYLHVPSIFMAYLAIFGVFIFSIGYLWKPDETYDIFSITFAELGALFSLIALISGSIWGKPTWNTYWTWDARITFTLILFLIFVGYSLLRYLADDSVAIAKSSAIIGICGFFSVPLNHLAVKWWRTLHQPSSIFSQKNSISAELKYFLLFSFVYFLCLLCFMFFARLRLEKQKREWKRSLFKLRHNH